MVRRLTQDIGFESSTFDEAPEPLALTTNLHLTLLRGSLVAPPLPGPELEPGQIWPPGEGRRMLVQAEPKEAIQQIRPSGDWTARRGPWQFHSGVNSHYDDHEAAQAAFLAWAKWHSKMRASLSPERCLAWVAEEKNSWRLWQIVRREESLATEVLHVLKHEPPEVIVPVLLEAARALEEAFSRLASAHLPVTLETIGVVEMKAVYIGTVPSPRGFEILESCEPARRLDFARLLTPVLDRSGFARSVKHTRVTDALLEIARTPAYQDRALTIVSAITSL